MSDILLTVALYALMLGVPLLFAYDPLATKIPDRDDEDEEG